MIVKGCRMSGFAAQGLSKDFESRFVFVFLGGGGGSPPRSRGSRMSFGALLPEVRLGCFFGFRV